MDEEDGTKEISRQEIAHSLHICCRYSYVFPSFNVEEFRIKESSSPRIPPEEIIIRLVRYLKLKEQIESDKPMNVIP